MSKCCRWPTPSKREFPEAALHTPYLEMLLESSWRLFHFQKVCAREIQELGKFPCSVGVWPEYIYAYIVHIQTTVDNIMSPILANDTTLVLHFCLLGKQANRISVWGTHLRACYRDLDLSRKTWQHETSIKNIRFNLLLGHWASAGGLFSSERWSEGRWSNSYLLTMLSLLTSNWRGIFF